jgi:hypothetical protein
VCVCLCVSVVTLSRLPCKVPAGKQVSLTRRARVFLPRRPTASPTHAGEARGRSLLGRDEPTVWHEAAAALPRINAAGAPPLDDEAADALRARAEALLERESALFEKDVTSRNAADARWLAQVRSCCGAFPNCCCSLQQQQQLLRTCMPCIGALSAPPGSAIVCLPHPTPAPQPSIGCWALQLHCLLMRSCTLPVPRTVICHAHRCAVAARLQIKWRRCHCWSAAAR